MRTWFGASPPGMKLRVVQRSVKARGTSHGANTTIVVNACNPRLTNLGQEKNSWRLSMSIFTAYLPNVLPFSCLVEDAWNT